MYDIGLHKVSCCHTSVKEVYTVLNITRQPLALQNDSLEPDCVHASMRFSRACIFTEHVLVHETSKTEGSASRFQLRFHPRDLT